MSRTAIVCDTSLLLYMGRIRKIDLLRKLYKQVFTTDQVACELDMGRMLREDTINPRNLDWVVIIPVSQEEIYSLPQNNLGNGERSVIVHARKHQGCVAGIDDYVARLFAEELGIKVIGMIGILLKAKRSMLISSVQPLLDAARNEGFRISRKLYKDALELAEE